MHFRGFISIRTTLPRNKSRFYYKRTFRKLFQMGFESSVHPSYVRVFRIAFLLPHAHGEFCSLLESKLIELKMSSRNLNFFNISIFWCLLCFNAFIRFYLMHFGSIKPSSKKYRKSSHSRKTLDFHCTKFTRNKIFHHQ